MQIRFVIKFPDFNHLAIDDIKLSILFLNSHNLVDGCRMTKNNNDTF